MKNPPGDPQGLLHAGGIFIKPDMAFVFEADSLKGCVDFTITLFSMDIVKGGKKPEILSAGQAPVKAAFLRGNKTDLSFCLNGVFDDVVPAHKGFAAGWDNQGCKDLDQRGLSGAIGADQRQDISGIHQKVDILKDGPSAEGFF